MHQPETERSAKSPVLPAHPLLRPKLGDGKVLSCLPWLWSTVLFPAEDPSPSRLRWGALLVLLALPGALLYPCLSFPLFEPDEGRYAEIPREMLDRGQWLVPYLQGEPYLDKPPLLYWLVIAGYRLFGVHDWSARLVPALAVHGCILLTYVLGRRHLGERAAFAGALALGLAPGFVSMGRLLLLDGLLALWVTLAFFAALEAMRQERLRWGWWLLAAIACGLGVLTKGPVALVLVIPPLWAQRRLNRPLTLPRWGEGRIRGRIGWGASLAFAGVALAVILPWYGAICLRTPGFAGHFLWQHNVVRFLAPFDHRRPIWFYGPIVLAGLLPASLWTLPFVRFLLSGDAAAVRRRCPALGAMLLAGGWCLLFFSLSGCKLPTYILPAFPPLALALGYYIAQSRWRQSRCLWIGAGLSLGLLGIGHYAVIPWYARYVSPLGNPEKIAGSCAQPTMPIVCYPRNCDSVAFFLGRDDLRSYRSKSTHLLVQFLQEHPRTVVLFTHRHSLEGLRQALPRELQLTQETALGLDPSSWISRFFASARRLTGETRPELYYQAVVERQAIPQPPRHARDPLH